MAERLVISGAREHNLKDIHLDLPRDQLIVITGLSGSGKSSLAFDTIYAEGQRRYVESLSAYARQFLGQMDKPDVDFIEGLSPAISIDQKSASRNPRSTVGTITEVYDYLRLLYARIGVPHDPETGERLIRQTPQQIVDRILEMEAGTRFQVLAPVVRGRKGTYDTLLADLAGQGYVRAIVDGELVELAEMAGATGLSGGTDGLELARYEMHDIAVVVDRLVLRDGVERRLTDSVETALRLADGIAEIEIVPRPDDPADADREPRRIVFSQHLARPSDGKSFEELAPRNFSFNSPYGACSHCDGLGTVFEVDPQLVVPDPDATLAGGAITPWSESRSRYYPRLLQAVCEEYGIPRDVPWRSLTARQHDMLLYAKGVTGRVQVRYQNRFGRRRVYQARFEGIVPHLMRRHDESESDSARENIEGYMRQVPCPDCGGARLNPLALAVTVDGRNIHELCAMSIADAAKTLAELRLDDRDTMIAEQVLKEIRARLGFLLDVGLDYLNLSRSAATLAGGEAQRIRLASQVGSGLVGVLYVLDEPSIGPAPARQPAPDRHAAAHARPGQHGDGGGARRGDHPGRRPCGRHRAGRGRARRDESCTPGRSTACSAWRTPSPGSTCRAAAASRCPRRAASATGPAWWCGAPARTTWPTSDVAFPLQRFVCVTGVSGSGKSSLVNEILHRALMQHIYRSKAPPGRHTRIDGAGHLDKVIAIDQSPIGRTPRSATPRPYTGAFDARSATSSLTVPEARARGYKPGRFSFNVKGGPLRVLQGRGLPSGSRCSSSPTCTVPCEVCEGRRYNREALEVTCSRASPRRRGPQHDRAPRQVGLLLGHPAKVNNKPHRHDASTSAWATSASASRQPRCRGGEAQRVKLASGALQALDGPHACTSSTSPPPGCTSRTSASCWECWAGWSTRATPWW